ncbi:hypothetical protein RAS2_14490 [Phycisphaerae bacterium RAS2]|nr:hypothetical protein RAS2_14490 [Phycisphaerae bacterium RAS2]
MSEAPKRLDSIRRTARFGRWLAVVGLASAAIGGFYLASWAEVDSFLRTLLMIGVAAVVFLVAAAFIFAWDLIDLLLKVEANSFRSYDILRDMHATMASHDRQLQSIAENAPLSDVARSIKHREYERNALRLAINEEIIRGDHEAAYALLEQLEQRHGYRNEADRLRRDVDQSRDRERNEKLQEAVQHVEDLIGHLQWDRARREMDRLLAEHRNDSAVAELPRLFARRRNEHKRRLLKEWDESVQRNEVDRGLAILKELDQFLTANEAAALEESARGVFRARLHNLGVQFSLAVTEQNWKGALEAGQQIIDEFPNTRMAREVREHMVVLSRRASENGGMEPSGIPLEAASQG